MSPTFSRIPKSWLCSIPFITQYCDHFLVLCTNSKIVTGQLTSTKHASVGMEQLKLAQDRKLTFTVQNTDKYPLLTDHIPANIKDKGFSLHFYCLIMLIFITLKFGFMISTQDLDKSVPRICCDLQISLGYCQPL